MLQKITSLLQNIAEWVILIFALLITGFITWNAVLFHFDSYDSTVYRENFFLTLFVILLFSGVILLLGRLLSPLYQRYPFIDKLLLGITLIWVVAFSYIFTAGAKTLPSSDSKSVYDIAVRMYSGDMGAVVPEGSYLSLWPFQTGMIFIFEKLMRIFHTTEPLMLQKFNIFYIALAVFSGYGCVKYYTRRLEPVLAYLVLAGSCFSLLLSAPSIYGDVPAVGLTMFTAYMFLLFERYSGSRLKWVWGILGMGASVLACTYRRNCLIFVVALVLLTLVRFIASPQKGLGLLVLVAVTALGSSLSTTVTQKYYEYYAQNVCGPGVPAVSYLAMGMQDGVSAPGFWNGYHANTYMSTGYDYEETVRLSRESISQSMDSFLASPSSMVSFYYQKLLCQWTDGSFDVYNGLDKLYEEDRSDFAMNVMYGKAYHQLRQYMDWHQSIVYLLGFLFTAYMLYRKIRRQPFHPFAFLLITAVIGGFLFSAIWEGGARYIMPYLFYLIPQASLFFALPSQWLARKEQ